MSDAIKLKISSAIAAYVRPGVPLDKKLAGIQTAPMLEPFERVTLLCCLLKDAEPAVKEAAGSAFSALPGEVALEYVQSPEAHPSLLHEIARAHYGNREVVNALLRTDLLSSQAREFLLRQQASSPAEPESKSPAQECAEKTDDDVPEDIEPLSTEDGTQIEDAAEIDEEDEEFLSKYKVAMMMGIGEKIKMALTGDKEWRAILIKDANKLVSGSVIKNARITDGEILNILKVGVQNDEIIRLICANKEWVKNYLIRKALISCPKTPLPNALRYLATMNEKDIAGYAKSKNISSVVATQAKRMLLAKKR
ncbi:MAG: hypothetical protein IPQ16_05105 [Geobacteraceae bacterium]|nr:hypothetical protein [Geobacteraceae bacterium]